MLKNKVSIDKNCINLKTKNINTVQEIQYLMIDINKLLIKFLVLYLFLINLKILSKQIKNCQRYKIIPIYRIEI